MLGHPTTTASATPIGTDSGSADAASQGGGPFGHHSPIASTNTAVANPANAGGGSPGTIRFGTILSVRFVAGTDQPSAGMGHAATAESGAHGAGAAASLRVASMGNDAMGLMPGTAMDGGSTTDTRSPLRPGPGQVTEFTIRMDDGSTVTEVQADDQGLLPGDWVQLIPGDHVGVARAE